jgi:hypothetical protein
MLMSAAEVLDTIDWKRIHGELTKLSRAKGEYDAEEARWILAGFRARVHAQLGYASFLEYV